jgi:hypothetical protein
MQPTRCILSRILRALRPTISAFLIATPTFAFAVDAAAEQAVSTVNVSEERSAELPETRKVRVIDITAANAASSDQSHWHDRVARPPKAKNAVRASAERQPVKVHKQKVQAARRSLPPTPDARSAFASAPTEHGGFGLFSRD